MEMFENISEVIANIGRAALFGFCVGFPFDVITSWSVKRKPSQKMLFAADFGYCLFVGFAFFVMLLAFADGCLRIAWFVTAFVGAVIYKLLLSRFVKRGSERVFSVCTAVNLFLKIRVFDPIRRFLKKILAISLKPLKFLIKYIKIVLFGAKSTIVRKRISGRKRKWLRKRNKTQNRKASYRE